MSSPPTLYAKTPLPRADGPRTNVPLVGGHLALDLLNSTPTHDGHHPDDLLAPGYVNLLQWAVAASVITPDALRSLERMAGRDPREAAAIRRRMLALRSELADVVAGLIHDGALSHELPTITAEVDAAQAARTLALRDGVATWHWKEDRALAHPLWEVSLAASDLLQHADRTRLRQCDAPDCERFFLDTSRNGLRRYCSSAGCGTVERVRRFRNRQRPGDS